MSTINSEIKMQGNNDAWFTTNATVVFNANIVIYHIDGRYKFTDGVTQLQNLPFLGSIVPLTLSGVLSNDNSTGGIPFKSPDGLTYLKVNNGTIYATVNDSSAGSSTIIFNPYNNLIGYTDGVVGGSFQQNAVGNKLTHDVSNIFNAPNNNFPNEATNQVTYLDSSNNLKGTGFTPNDVELNTNKATSMTGNETSNTVYLSAKAIYDWATSVFTTASAVASQITTALTGYATQAWVTAQGYGIGTIKGSVGVATGLIPFGTGTADEVTTNANLKYENDNLQLKGSVNGTVLHTTTNYSTGNSAGAGYNAVNNVGKIAQFFKVGTGYSTYKSIKASDCGFYTDSGDFSFLNDSATGGIQFTSGGASIQHIFIKPSGDVGISKNSFFGDTATTSSAYIDIKGGSASNASMRIRVSSALPTTQLDGEINYVGTRLHHYNGIDNTIAYLSDITATSPLTDILRTQQILNNY